MRPSAATLGKEARARLASRATAPSANRIVLYVVLGFFALLVFYVVYEFGQYNGGYDRLTVSRDRAELEVQIDRLQASNRQLRTQVAELDTIRLGHAREQAELARTIGDLQSQVARESQQLAFYRGLMAKAPNELGVRVGEVRITRSRHSGAYEVHVALLRSGRPDNIVSGTLALHVDGDMGHVLDLPDLTGSSENAIPFSFQYYKNIDEELTLPPSFHPLHLGIDVQSSQKDAPVLHQTVTWSVTP